MLGGIGAGIVTISALYYLLDVVRGSTRPQRTSWGVWAVVGVLGVTSADAGGAGPGAWSSAVDAGACSVTFLLALHPRFGKPGNRRSDAVLFALACAGVLLWRAGALDTEQAALCAVAIDAVALWPTLREAWHQPHLESRLSWAADCAGHVLCLAAIGGTGLAAVAFPAYMLAATIVVTGVLVRRRGLPQVEGGPSPVTCQSEDAVAADTPIARADTNTRTPPQRRSFRGHVSSDIGVRISDLRPLTGTPLPVRSPAPPRPSPPGP